MTKYVFINSGSPYSKLLAMYLYLSIEDGDEIHSLFIDFGLPNNKAAAQSAQTIAEQYCSSHGVLKSQLTVDGLELTPFYYNFATGESIPMALMPEEQRDDTNISDLYHYPLLKQKLLLEGCAYAKLISADKVVTAEVHTRYDDEQLAKTIEVFNHLPPRFHMQKRVEIELPFVEMSLPEILEMMNLPIDAIKDTVRCLAEVPCGKCYRCVEMAEVVDYFEGKEKGVDPYEES